MKETEEKAGELKKRLVKGTFWSFLATLINKFGALFFSIILARYLMPENYGVYVTVFATSMIFNTFTDLGLNRTMMRYLSSAMVKSKKKISSYYKYILKLKAIISFSTSILLALLAYPLSVYVFRNPSMIIPFLLASFLILVLSFEGLYTKIFYAIEKVYYVSIKESIVQISRIVLAFFVFYLVASRYHIIGIFVMLILVNLIMLIFLFFRLKSVFPELHSKTRIEIDKQRVRKFAKFLTIISISEVFFAYIDTVILGIFLLPEYVAYYKAAFTLVLGAVGLVGFPNAILLPILTKLNKNDTKKVLNKLFRYLAILAIPASFGILVLGRHFLRLLYGYSYLSGYLPLSFLGFLVFPFVAVGMIVPLFSAKEKPQLFAKLILIVGLMNIILNIIFIKSFSLISPIAGTIGAALATIISWLFYFFMSLSVAKKDFKIDISLKNLVKPFIASVIMAFVLYKSLLYVGDMTLLIGIFLVTLGIFIYFLSLLLIRGIKKEDIRIFSFIFKR